jgi:hypothetical protein
MVEKDDGTLVWTPDTRARIAGYAALANDNLRRTLAKLAKAAVKARDHTLAKRLLDRALALGAEGRDVRYASGKLASVKGKRPKSELVAPIRAEARQAEFRVARLFAARAAQAGDDRDTSLRILREALRADKNCVPALELLERHAPKTFPLGDARAWLDWHLEVGRYGFSFATGNELELKRARHHWRPDLYGIGSPEILLITASRNFELVGRCLRHGDLLCRELSAMFRTDTPVRREPGPLTLFLYLDKKAFKEHAADYRDIDDPRFLDWWTSNWSERDDITRFYWPSRRDHERRFLAVFRRELTQHWMHARSPAWSVSQASRAWKNPGYWLELGFRNLMAQGRYDVDRKTRDLFNPRSKFLDGLQALARQQADKLHPWTSVFALSGRDAGKLPDKNVIPVVRNWSLSTRLYSVYHVYREQASGAFAYLWMAEQGKYRKRLLQAVADYHHNRAAAITPEAITGLKAEEVGQKAVAFAKGVAKGWRPGDKG